MKINYREEDYVGQIWLIGIEICILLFIISFLLLNNEYRRALFSFDISFIILFFCFLIPLIIFIILSMKEFKKRKKVRDKNMIIIKNGKQIKGKINKMWVENINYGYRNFHTNKAQISFYYNEREQEVTVSNLNFKVNKKYINKEVNVYIFNNEYYIDMQI